MWRTTICSQFFLLITFDGKPKINYFDFVLLVYQDVIQFQVSMHNGLAVHKGNTFNYLFKHFSDLGFGQPGLHCLIGFLDEMEKALTLTQLHDKVNISSQVYYFMDGHNIWMIKRGKYEYLPPESD